ncbi:MAG: hypothetical protein HOV94_10395 [Saccharothrix sp.]|nr:hypothetical protein [Saccharothrix sp.]
MQAGQVSAWVPIVVALLAGVFGVVGVAIGQGANARRERQREDLRWQRERERLTDERAHAERLHWRSERLRVYAKFVANLSDWHLHLAQASKTTLSHQKLSASQKAKIYAARSAAMESCSAAAILASDLARAEVTTAMERLHKLHTSAVEEESGPDAWSLAETLVRVENAIRVELGLVDGVALPLPFSQAPPFGPSF